MGRFLIYFSYLGTRYSGVQYQKGVSVRGNLLKTVGGSLLEALKCLRPSNEIKITLSSRTDKGVHALKNACHVDLIYPDIGKEYNPIIVTNVMNNYLKQGNEDIRILQTMLVPNRFNARLSAVGRKYVYRLGHILGSDVKCSHHNIPFDSESFCAEMMSFAVTKSPYPKLPVGEPLSTLDACKAVIYRTQLDINKLISAAEMMSGIHNYRSFTSRRKENADYVPHPVKMLTIGVKRGQPFGHRLQKCGLDVAENVEFWDIHVHSRSFMYKQIRRVVGAMVLVARNIISLADVRNILDNPQKDYPFSSRMVASENGLFLLDVQYNPKDLEFVQTDVIMNQQEVLTSFDADTIPTCDISSKDDPAIDTNLHNPIAADDKEQDLLSEDDDPISSVPSETNCSEIYKSTGNSEKISNSS